MIIWFEIIIDLSVLNWIFGSINFHVTSDVSYKIIVITNYHCLSLQQLGCVIKKFTIVIPNQLANLSNWKSQKLINSAWKLRIKNKKCIMIVCFQFSFISIEFIHKTIWTKFCTANVSGKKYTKIRIPTEVINNEVGYWMKINW